VTRRCKCGCGEELPPAAKCTDRVSKKRYASIECITRHNRAKEAAKYEKVIKDRNNKFTRNYQLSDLKIRKAAAKKACHEYIRTRDKDKPCICCGKPLGEEYHAGHFLESGNNPQVRYDEDNIHGQRIDCNYFKGGDSGDYKENLIVRIGADKVNAIISKKSGTIKRTAQDYLVIENYFKGKLKGN
jgi:hypothetical protein